MDIDRAWPTPPEPTILCVPQHARGRASSGLAPSSGSLGHGLAGALLSAVLRHCATGVWGVTDDLLLSLDRLLGRLVGHIGHRRPGFWL